MSMTIAQLRHGIDRIMAGTTVEAPQYYPGRVAAEVAAWIERCGITRESAAELLDVSQAEVTGICRGNRLPPQKHLERFADAMGMPFGHFASLVAEERQMVVLRRSVA